jgi:hypothetical protein
LIDGSLSGTHRLLRNCFAIAAGSFTLAKKSLNLGVYACFLPDSRLIIRRRRRFTHAVEHIIQVNKAFKGVNSGQVERADL